MNNQEAIASLRTLCHNCKLFPKCAYEKPECFKAIELAISALQAQEEKTHFSREDTTLGVKKTCVTCKHYPPESKWPCIDCDMRNPADRWEAQQVNEGRESCTS